MTLPRRTEIRVNAEEAAERTLEEIKSLTSVLSSDQIGTIRVALRVAFTDGAMYALDALRQELDDREKRGQSS